MKSESFLEKESGEKYSSRVSLEFFRHDEKEKSKPDQPEQEIPLTKEGRRHSKASSKNKDISQSVAFGSRFRRARETATYKMAGNMTDITGDETLEELEKKVNAQLKVGKKVAVDERLSLEVDEESPYGKEANVAYGKVEWLKFLVEDSDRLANKYEDKESSTYSRQASNIAQIIQKYAKVAPRFDSLVQEKGYEKEMKRFFGSHQGILESFLLKMIEKTKGKEEADRLVKLLKNQGFDFSEGFHVDIDTSGGYSTIKISYERRGDNPENSFIFEEEINPALLQDIIREGLK